MLKTTTGIFQSAVAAGFILCGAASACSPATTMTPTPTPTATATSTTTSTDVSSTTSTSTPITPPPSGSGPGTEATPTRPDGAPDVSSDPAAALLTRLERAAADIDRFGADLTYIVINEFTEERVIRKGRVLYQRANATDGDGARAITPNRTVTIRFKEMITDGRMRPRARRYTFSENWLVEVDDDQRIFTKYRLAEPGTQIDPFRLGEGPFPLPVGQPATAVLERFRR